MFKANCLLCNDKTVNQLALCSKCYADLPWNNSRCKVCALPLTEEQKTCPYCANLKFSFNQVFSAFSYIFPIDILVKDFKNNAKFYIGKTLTLCLIDYLRRNNFNYPDILIPVASSNKAMLERGFSQTILIAKIMARHLKIPMLKNALICDKNHAQKQLDALSRKANLANAFRLNGKFNFNNQHIGLIDDVLTTGATADVISHLLLNNGAKYVDVYCIARTTLH